MERYDMNGLLKMRHCKIRAKNKSIYNNKYNIMTSRKKSKVSNSFASPLYGCEIFVIHFYFDLKIKKKKSSRYGGIQNQFVRPCTKKKISSKITFLANNWQTIFKVNFLKSENSQWKIFITFSEHTTTPTSSSNKFWKHFIEVVMIDCAPEIGFPGTIYTYPKISQKLDL